MMFHEHTVGPSPDVAAFIVFLTQAKLVWFEHPHVGLNQVDATGTQGIGVCSLHRNLLGHCVG